MIIQRFFFLLIFLFIPFICFTQKSANSIVQSIQFEGLQKTKKSYIEDIIQTQIGHPIDIEIIETDVQLLKNISGIGHATYQIDTLSNSLVLNFIIEEVKTFLPIIKFGGIKDNVWFQLGFVDINWQGKGQTFSGYYQNNDQRHSGQIYYKLPFFRNKPWGFTASLTKWASREPLYFPEGNVLYNYDNNSIALTGIRHFEKQRSLEFGGTYFIEKYTKSANQLLETSPGPLSLRQPKLLTKLEYQTNKLDYHYFYLKGNTWRTTLQNVYNTLDQTWFHSLQFQGKQFYTIGKKINLAFRLRLAISSNNDSPFAPFVADSHVNLRGVGNRIDRGTAQVVLNAEYRHTIFHNDKWAAQAVAFMDVGSWRNPGGTLEEILQRDQFREFVGGGVRLIYKKVYGAVLRIDYGIDVFNKEQRGFVIGLGQYF